MAREIAVLTDLDGKSASLLTPGKLTVYRKFLKEWSKEREMPFFLDQGRGLADMRRQMQQLIAFLDGCTVFVALSVVGVPYYELEKAGVSVWEFEGAPDEFLDYVNVQEENSGKEPPKLIVVPKPEERSPGSLFISIKEIQETDIGITSKQALLPVVRQGKFRELEVVCAHVPPWLELEAMGQGYGMLAEKLSSGGFKVILSPKPE